jgi:Ribonuclease G/E
MESEDHANLLEKAFQFQLALVSNGSLGNDNFSAVQKEAKEIFQDIEGEMKPWSNKRTRAQRQQAEKAMYDEMWQEVAGFSMFDKSAFADWEKDLRNAMAGSQAEFQESQRQQGELESNFAKRVKEIQKKRARQQGR